MPFIKTLTSLVILFVAVNLGMTIYNSLNRAWRERFENQNLPHLAPSHHPNS